MTGHPLPVLQGTLLLFELGTVLLLWLVSLWRKDASIIDIWWGPGIALTVDLAAFVAAPQLSLSAILALGLVNIWAVRLGVHIFARHHGEDYRYAAMRNKHGHRWWWWSLVQVFLLQGILIWLVASPLVAAVTAAGGAIPVLVWLGALVAASGLILEAVADAQLTRFRADPANKGAVMDRGVWSWSRHPNYFGDTAMWWGLFLLALGAGGWMIGWTILSPIIMTVLLLKVSGVSMLEETIGERRPGYAAYARRTSAFIPFPPKKDGPRKK